MSSRDGIGEIDVKDLLEELDISNIHDVGRYEVGFSCPRTDGHSFGDANPSNHISRIAPHPFRCKSCGWTGTAFSLVGAVLHLSPAETTRWLRERYGGGYREPRGGSVAAEMAEWDRRRADRQIGMAYRANPPLPVEEDCIGPRGIFNIDWRSDHEAAEYTRGRGFHPDYLDAIGVGYDSWTERVAIPIRLPDGRLAGFKGRTIHDYVQRKYDVLGDAPDRKLRYDVGYRFPLHDTRTVIFGLDRVKPDDDRTSVVVCEGEFDAIALRQAGVLNAVAIGTTTITEEQQRLLRWHTAEIVIFYDTDDAGFAAKWGWYDIKERWHPGIIEKLSPYLRIRVVEDHEGDPASLPPEACVEMIQRARSWMSIAVS